MMDIHESAQEFRHLAAKSTSQAAVSDDEEEMVLNYSDSEDDHSSKLSKNENLKEALDLLDKVSDNLMDGTEDDFPDKMQNGDTDNSESSNNVKENDDSGSMKSDFFQTAQNEDAEKLSLLDRFLSSEVVENGTDNTTELIGDELVDEPAGEVIDENALLDEITNDLDNSQEDLDDECLLDDITEIEAREDKLIDSSTNEEVTSSQPSNEQVFPPSSNQDESPETPDKPAVEDESVKNESLEDEMVENETVKDEVVKDVTVKDETVPSETVTSGTVTSETVIENSEVVTSSEMDAEPTIEPSNKVDAMEIDEHDINESKKSLISVENNCKEDSTEPTSEKKAEKSDENVIPESVVATTTADEPESENKENISLKVDEDNDNDLLEEMMDSPRSSEHESLTSDLLEKDDGVTHDSNDDEKMEQQLIQESSNENSNMSDSGEMTENGLHIVEEFKHDAEIHIMDEASDLVETIEAKIESTDVKEEMETDSDVKQEKDADSLASIKQEVKVEVGSTLEEASDILCPEKPSNKVVSESTVDDESEIAQSSACKRKSEAEVSQQPENKRQRVEEEVPISTESVSSSEQTIPDKSKIDDTENDSNSDSNLVTSNTVEEEETPKESNANKEDDDDVLIVGEIKQTETTTTQPPTDSEVQEPVQKAKILILDTQAIAKDLGEEKSTEESSGAETGAISEKEHEVSTSQKEPPVPQVEDPVVESTEKTQEAKTKEPTKLVLDPPPQKTLCPTAFSLNFVRKFQKNFDKMTRNDLEELLLQKCVEVIVHKSDYADMRNKIEKQESKLQSYSTKYQELSKQYRDLEMVHQRVVKDLEIKNQSAVTPVKITRAVGLQVSLPRKEITIQKPPPQVANNIPNATQQNNAAALAAKRRKIPLQRDPAVLQQQQQQQQAQQQQLMRQNMMARRNELQIQQRNQFPAQQQQQQGQNNLLKQQLIQNNNANNFKQQSNVRKPLTPQFSPVAAAQLQNASPKTPGSADRPRVPPVILKKMNSGRMGSVNNSSTPNSANASVYVTQSKMNNVTVARSPATATTAAMNNLIDLTDEEDSKRVLPNGTNPPALVAIPNNQGTKTVVAQGKVSFVTLKSNAPQAQLQMVRQNQLTTMQKIGNNYVPIAPKNNAPSNQQIVVRKQQPATTLSAVQRRQHPAPLPYPNNQPTNPYWKLIPPRPIIRISNIESGIVISWTMDEMTDKHAEVASYQIYAYQETSAAPSPETWRHVGDVKAMLLPMAVTLTQFQEGQRYHFAVRAVDEHSRYGIFSLPKTWT